MARLSREKNRDHDQAAHAGNPAAAPIDVHVPVTAAGAGAAVSASVGGVPVVAGPGEEIQQAVLNRLHRIAIASGHAVLATVRDERIGYVVPLRVEPDGSSHFTGEPVRTESASVQRPDAPAPVPAPRAEPLGDAAPTRRLRTVTGSQAPDRSAPTFRLRALPEPSDAVPPGTVLPPKGEFGPPPPMDARPPLPLDARPHTPVDARPLPPAEERPLLPMEARPLPLPEDSRPRAPHPEREPGPELGPDPGPGPKPTPPRGFDAVAEAVLGDEPLTVPGETRLAEPMGRINDAVRTGRIDAAARLAEQTMTEASTTLGPEHPEVLRLGELTAYIAYLAGEPLRAFRLSLGLAGIRRRTGDAEAAYGNVRSAATAWRAVRDPQLGLELGGELIELWTELAAESGPAADEIEELESARARMGRLTERCQAQEG